MPTKSLVTMASILAASISLQAAPLITNGGFENWSNVTQTPPKGSPNFWYNNQSGTALPGGPGVLQSAGLTSGSDYSATLADGYVLAQVPNTPTNIFTLSYNFAQTEIAGATNVNQGLRLNLYTGSNVFVMALALFRDSAGLLSLRAYNGSAWQNITTGLLTSTYDSVTGLYTTANVYSLTMEADWTTATYSIALSLNGGPATTFANLNAFYSNPTGANLNNVYFINTNGGGDYAALDNVSLNSVPEPATLALAGLATLTLLLARKRKP